MGKLSKELKVAASKGLFSAALRAKRDLVSRVIPNLMPPPVDRGIYRAGWQVQRLPNGAAIYNPLPHARFIENGVPAGNVVLSNKAQKALAEWVQRKLGGRRKAPPKPSVKTRVGDLARKLVGKGLSARKKFARDNTSDSVNKAKARFDKAKASWEKRAKKAQAKGKAAPARPRPPAALSGGGRLKGDGGYAWQIAGAILHSLKRRGIFRGGKGFGVLTKYTDAHLPGIIREEVERELAKVTKK